MEKVEERSDNEEEWIEEENQEEDDVPSLWDASESEVSRIDSADDQG